MVCFVFFQLLQQGVMGNILNVDIQSCVHIITILRLYFIIIGNPEP
jgi:hypothetical protein